MSKERAEVLVGRKRNSDLCGFEGAKDTECQNARCKGPKRAVLEGGSREADEWPNRR